MGTESRRERVYPKHDYVKVKEDLVHPERPPPLIPTSARRVAILTSREDQCDPLQSGCSNGDTDGTPSFLQLVTCEWPYQGRMLQFFSPASWQMSYSQAAPESTGRA